MKEKIVIFGTAAGGQVVYYYMNNYSHYEVAGFTVDSKFMKKDKLFRLPVVPFEDVTTTFPPNKFKMCIAIGHLNVNKVRAEKYYQAKQKGYKLVSYVHPSSILNGVEIGENCFILENNKIDPYVKIGNNVSIGSCNLIGHHSVIGDHCFITSHVVAGAYLKLEPYCFLGLNSTIRERITIARESVIGAGAVVLEDTKEKSVYLARPAQLHIFPSDMIGLGRIDE